MATVAALNVGSDIWNAEMYGTLSVAWRTRAIIKHSCHLLRIRWSYMRLNADMEDFLGKFYSVFEKAQRGTLPRASEPATPAQLKESIDTLWNLNLSLQGIYDLTVRKGLKNKVLLTSQVDQLACSKERLVDLVQWLTDISDPEEINNLNSMLSDAEEEYKRGETVTIR
jgi:hypothetical protein